MYSGYKKIHGLTFHSVIAPISNGLIVDLYGCIVGRRSDSFMLARSDLLSRMADLVQRVGSPVYFYRDPAYPLSMYVLRGYKGAVTPQQKAFSTEMSRLRESLEWGFAMVLADWLEVHQLQEEHAPSLAAHWKILCCGLHPFEHQDVHDCKSCDGWAW